MPYVRLSCWVVAVVAGSLVALSVHAASGSWTGTENALWTNSANWSASPYPGSASGETATFDGAGNGNTSINLTGLSGVRNVAFGSSAAAYTFGTAGQTLILGSTVSAASGLAAPQTFNAALQLGSDRAAGTYNLTNPSPALVTYAGGIAGAASGGTAGTKSLNIGGNTRVDSVIANGGASSVTLTIRRGTSYTNTVTLAAANTFSGSITVSDGVLVLKNSAALGSGTKTVTIANNADGARPSIRLDGSDGDLDIPASVSWNTSNAKEGALVNVAGTNTVRGNFSLTSGDGETWLISRGGKLMLSGNLSAATTSRALRLQGSADGEISGVIANGLTPDMPVYKNEGAGTWALSGVNTYSGFTEISAGALEVNGLGRIASSSEVRISNGATFRVRNAASASHADRLKDTGAVKLSGGTFDFAGDGGSYSETAGALTLLSGSNSVAVAPSASLTFGGFSVASGATVDFTLGAGAHLFLDGQPEGLIGLFATANGTLAYYSLTEGVIPSPTVAIAAKGDTVPNASGTVAITTEGSGGPNELTASVTTVGALMQDSPYASTLNTAGKTLDARVVRVAENGADLTLGVVAHDGQLTASTHELALINDSTSALTVNALIADSMAPLALFKAGAGTAVLGASNTFSGPVQVSSGDLLLRHPLALQNATLGTGGVRFDPSVVSHAFTVGALTNTVTMALEDTDGNPVTLSAFTNVPAAVFAGGLTGSGTLVKEGDGVLTLAGDNAHTGATVVRTGVVNVTTSNNGLGLGNVVNNGTVNLTRGNVTYSALTNSISGAGTFNVTLASGTGTAIANGEASGFTGVWNVGVTATGGKLNLSGADNATATVNVLSNGTVYVTGPVTKQATAVLYGGKPGEQNGQLRVDAGADWAGPVFLAGDHTDPGFGLVGSGSSTGTISGLIADFPGSGLHALHKQGSGQLNITHPANTYQGPTWLRSGGTGVTSLKNIGQPSSLGNPSAENAVIKIGTSTTSSRLAYLGTGDTTDRPLDMAGTTGYAYIEQSGSGLLKFTAPAVLSSGSGAKSFVLQGDTDGVGEIAGVIGDSAGGVHTLVKQGTGKWVLSAENTFTGPTDIRNGTLSFAHPRAAAGSSLIQATTAPGGNLSLDNDAVNEPDKNFTVGVNCPDVSVFLGAGPSGTAVTHAFNDWSLSRVTVTVARAASVLSGTPSVYVRTLNLSSGGVGDTRLRADDTEVRIGTAGIRSGAYAKTLILDGDSHANTITGEVANGLAALSVQKEGAGTWTLAGSNTYSGATTVNAGTLVIAGTAASSSTVSLAGGRLVLTNTVAATDHTAALGALIAAGSATLVPVTAESGHTASATLASLTAAEGAALDVAGELVAGGSDRSRVFVANQPDGYVGPWITLNGSGPVMHSAALGLHIGAGFVTTNLAARGDTIPDDAAASARITAPGTSGSDTLAGAFENSLAFLTQTAASGEAATVAMPGKTLKSHGLAIEDGGASLTLGTVPGEGTVTALATGGKLDLANGSGSALTVNAAVADNGSPVALASSGDVTLAGPASYSGRTILNGGTLTFASGAPQSLPGEVAGPGGWVKNGTNVLHVLGANTYTGPTYINNGTVRVDQDSALGTADAGTFVNGQTGGTLDLGCTPDVGGTRTSLALRLGSERITIQGAGYQGMGAIVNTATGMQYNAVSLLELAGDATVGGIGRWDLRNSPATFTMNDYTLTKTGPNMVGLTSANVYPGAGNMVVQQGVLRLEGSTKLNGGDTNVLTVLSGAEFELYKTTNLQYWRLVLQDGATFDAANASDNSGQNRWAGPVQLNGAVTLTGGNGAYATLLGPISGSGPLNKTGSGSTVTIGATNNTFTGATLIGAGTLVVSNLANVGEASSLGQPGNAADGTIKLGSTSNTGTLTYYGNGVTTDRILDMAGTTGGATVNHSTQGLLKFVNDVTTSGSGVKTLSLGGSFGGSGELSGSINNSAGGKTAVTKNGTGTWTLSGNNAYTGDVNVAAGTLILAATNNQGLGAINVGSSAGNGLLKLGAGTLLTGGGGKGNGSIRIGNNGGARSALYMTGGTVTRTPATGDDGLTVGRSQGSYGYFNMSGGVLNITRIQTGASGATLTSNTVGNVRITGGTVTLRDYILLARGPGCVGAFTLEGGTLYHTNTTERISLGYEGGRAELNLTGGTLLSGTNVIVRQTVGNTTGIVNLCAGRLTTSFFLNNAGTAFLNFAGGTLAASANSFTNFIPAAMSGVSCYGAYGPFAGGATLDTAGRDVTVAAPILAPAGNGVYGVALSDGGSGFVGEPYVSIVGDGVGATAVANMEDDGTGSNRWRVASVTITCPGTGFSSTPTVTFVGGGVGAVAPTVSGVTLAANASGGLTKLGTGALTLSAANTYGGSTVISNGTLRLRNALALPTATQVVLAGGTLDLGGYTVTNTISGVGGLTNGTLETVISPAGEGVVGTETLALSGVQLRGRYIVDVTAAGACDLLQVQGGVDVSGMTVELVAPELLVTTKEYTLATVSGALSGRFALTNAPENWHLAYVGGEVKLIYSRGTVLLMR